MQLYCYLIKTFDKNSLVRLRDVNLFNLLGLTPKELYQNNCLRDSLIGVIAF